MALPQSQDEDGMYSINITPLVDIFLVLLILVMISSSLLNQGEIPVAVPQAAHTGERAPNASGLTMSIDRRVFLDGRESDSASVIQILGAKVAVDSAHQVLIAADKGLLYEDVTRLLDWVRGAGIRKYSLKVEKPERG